MITGREDRAVKDLGVVELIEVIDGILRETTDALEALAERLTPFLRAHEVMAKAYEDSSGRVPNGRSEAASKLDDAILVARLNIDRIQTIRDRVDR